MSKLVKLSLIMLALLATTVWAYEGYAPLTTGGEGGTVVWVTNTNSWGSGSLRAAIEGSGAGKEIVKFQVGGSIYLDAEIKLTSPYITIDGSSAPSAVALKAAGAYRGLLINTHDVIVNNLRFRDFPGEGIQIFGDYNIIIDHCSITGTGDGALDTNGGTDHITLSWNLIGGCMEGHRAYGIQASYHHNLYRENNRRQPKIFKAGPEFDFRNNVVEYWTGSGTNVVNSQAGVNIINNYYGSPAPTESCALGFNVSSDTSNFYTAGNYSECGDTINSTGDRGTPVTEPSVTTSTADADLRTFVRGQCGALPRTSVDEYYAGPEVTDTDPPAVPTGLSVSTYSSNKLSLNWNDNTEEDLDYYNVYRSTSAGGTYTVVGTPGMSYFLSEGLNPSTTYYYKLSAVDLAANESSLSSYASGTTAAPDSTPPCVPSGLSATGNDANVFLNWNDCTQGDLYGYNVYRSTASGGTYTLIADADIVAGSQYTDYTVTNSVTYYYKVASVDTSDNISAQSSYVSATPVDVTAPAAPTGLTAIGKDTLVILNWNNNLEPDVAGYNVYRSTTSGSGYSAVASGVPDSNYNDTNVTNYTTYYYVVAAVDTSDNESADSNEASAMPEPDLIPPAVPSGVSATAISCTRIDLNWNDNTEEDFGSYNVYYSTVSGGPYTLLEDGLTVSAYSDSDLVPGTLRYYVVKSVDLVGNASANSSQVSATTPQPNYYVDGATGLDTNAGTSGAPWKTIGKAASTMTYGQTVLIRPGIYTETVSPVNHGDSGPITYLADSAGKVIVQAPTLSDIVFDINKRYQVLDGLTIRNGEYGVWFGSYSRGGEIRNCIIYNNVLDGVYVKSPDVKVHNCLIYESDRDGLRFGTDVGCSVTKSTISDNGEDGITTSTVTTKIIDSIITHNDEDGIEAGAISVTYSDVWGNETNDYLGGAYPGEGTISADPCFADVMYGDFSLKTGSPCIGTASDGDDMGFTYAASSYLASEPTPVNGAETEEITVVLSWVAGADATSHDVYLGTSSSGVLNATHASGEFKGNQSGASYDPTLNSGVTYYWRIDEIDSGSNTHTGSVWSFATRDANQPSANYYVNGATGNDNNSGTSPSQAWKTIGKAVSTLTAGKTVLVFPGTYAEGILHNTNAGSSGNPIVYRAYYESGTVTINATGKSYGFKCTKAYLTLDGFEVKNSNSNGVLISGDAADGGIVRNCNVHNNGAEGVKLDATDNSTVQNCLIYDNNNNGIEIVSNADGATIDNCTIYSNNSNDGIHTSTSDTTVIDCIITNNTQWGIDTYGTVAVGVTYTDTWNNTSGNYDDLTKITVGTGSISQDPKFVNPAAGDFHLQMTSPCKETASDGGDMGYRYIN